MGKGIMQIEFAVAEADGGRGLVSIPDLKGFHFVLEAEERADPLDAMRATLGEFLRLLNGADLKGLWGAERANGSLSAVAELA